MRSAFHWDNSFISSLKLREGFTLSLTTVAAISKVGETSQVVSSRTSEVGITCSLRLCL